MAPEGSQLEIWGIESYGPNLEQRLRITAANKEDSLVASGSEKFSIPLGNRYLCTIDNDSAGSPVKMSPFAKTSYVWGSTSILGLALFSFIDYLDIFLVSLTGA